MPSLRIRSRLLRFREASPQSLEYLPDGVLQVDNGIITVAEDAQLLKSRGYDLQECDHRPGSLIMAGFIDAHVHAPQLGVVASYGEQLLDWLNHYTFPAEMKFADPEYSYLRTQDFIEALLANGTTSGMVFSATFKHSCDHLFEIADRYRMRLIAGKVLMDRHAPAALLDTAQSGSRESAELIRRWHGHGRLGYAVTPRFSGTSTPEQLTAAGQLLQLCPDLWVQTHLSENVREVTWTRELFPEATDYLHTYEMFGLHTSRTLFAHGLHLSDSELERIAKIGSGIAFCPSSNLFLGSGLFDIARFHRNNIEVALATDVGAGTSLSPFKAMGDGYKVCQLRNYSLTAAEAFYLTTLGAARALRIDHLVGNLNVGMEADFIEISATDHRFVRERLKLCRSIEEELFVYMTCGDDRLIASTTVAGIERYRNPRIPAASKTS